MLRGSENFQNGAFHFNSKGIRTKLDSEKGLPNTLAVDPFELPPPDLSKHLLDLYFTHFYPLLPLLHKKSFLQKLDSDHPPPPLLLNAIYAVASRISPDIRVRTDPTQRDTAGDIFLERARILLDFEWDDFQVSTVQSLLLLSSHQNGALKNIRGWLYSGLAFRMCQNLGLNRNCDSWNLSDAEKEERKRVFYCSFVLDRLTCAMHGRSPMIDDRDLDAPYPSEVDEDDRHNKPTIMEDFHQLIKLCEIIGDILCQVYMVKGRRKLSVMASPDNVIAKLDKALNQWMTKLPPSVQYRPPNTRMGKKAPAPKLELCQIHMLFYTSLILLHRPFIPGYNQTTTPSVFPSASICTFAANKILDIVECLMAEGKLKNVNNYALYFMFTAGIIFINDALSTDSMFAFEAKISINKIIRAMDEIETTWLTSARHCNILAELAGLRELNLKNIDESHSRKAKPEQSKYAPPMAITVPNSPIISNDHTLSPPEYRNPIDTERGVEHRLPDYLTQYGGYKPIERTRSPNQFNTSSSNSVDYSTHSSPSSHKTEAMDIGQDRPFDSIGTAFWGIPTSFDIDEWNNYFSHQQGQANERMAYPIINTSQHMNTNTTNNTHNNNNNNYSSSSNNNYHNLNNGNNHRNNNRSNNNNHSYTFMPTRPPTAGRNPHW
ncbi:fungal-specific transcription factor domain-containing protein [Pilobolus umbonatus]|nr:fungal-specific transcription factor domain-containing protein [Pilobolus umbonatus]